MPKDAVPIADIVWPPDELLDLEPEVCHCLPHGHELPCPQCDLGQWLASKQGALS